MMKISVRTKMILILIYTFSVFALIYLITLVTFLFYSSLTSTKAALTSPLLNIFVIKSRASSISLKASVNSFVVKTN